ncbi:MAG: hypothetical protein U0R51_06785 [Solirubrobacterales bacterium]
MASSKSRKRRKRRARSAAAPAAADAPVEERTTRPAPARAAKSAEEEPPPAPWGSFPLVELCVLASIVMLILGFFVVGGSRGPILIAAGLALGSIGGLELSIREHFAGYQSHTAVLAGVPALIVLGLLFYLAPAGLPQLARAAIGIAVFAVAAAVLMKIFSSRSGGDRYRFAPLRRRNRR